MMPHSKRLRVLLRAGFLVALLAYACAFSEVFIRLVKPQPIMPRHITAGMGGVRGNIPGARYVHTTAETNVAFAINSQGMRDDRTYPVAKPSGVCRIAMFGDSFFMGYEVSLDDSIAKTLKRDLDAAGYNVEVLNFAVSGFGTAESLKIFQSYGATFSPDIVLLEWHSSDFLDNARSGLFRVEAGAVVPDRQSYLPAADVQERLQAVPFYRFVSEHSHLFNLVREQIAAAARQAVGLLKGSQSQDERGGELFSIAPPYAVALSRALLLAFRDAARANGAGILLAEVPMRFKGGLRDTSTLMGDDLPAQLDVVSSRAALLRDDASLESLFYASGAGHFTPRGTKIFADQVARATLERGLLKAGCRSRSPEAPASRSPARPVP